MRRIPLELAGALLLAASADPGQSVFRVDPRDRGLPYPEPTAGRPQRTRNVPRAQPRRRFRRLGTVSAELLARRQHLIDQTIEAEAVRYRIDPLLIHAMIHQESGYNPNALSPKGALGVMQLMPLTAQRFGVRERRDIVASIRAGVKYLVWLLDHYQGDVRLGLAAYNAGEARVDRAGAVPRNGETPNYVRSIETRYLKLARLRGPGRRPQAVPPAAAKETSGAVPQRVLFIYRFPKAVPPHALLSGASTPESGPLVASPAKVAITQH
jgi:soluble lytic murein transglycosylase-like protein